ncbi:Eukaryotic aspartyl protease [Aphelenchoides fujianensis]|nr:Eukaryotic aspartyl protease [Aphelenchoides fujianensis]
MFRVLLGLLLIGSSTAAVLLPLRRVHVPANRIRPAAGSSQPLLDYDDLLYVAAVSLGTPAQDFQLVLDSSSADLWVVDAGCTEDQCRGFPESGYSKHAYDRSQSSTFEEDGRPFELSFGNGESCTGEWAVDRLSLGDFSADNQTFGAATSIPAALGYEPIDGWLGLGLGSASNATAPVRNLLAHFDQPLFTIWLDRHFDPVQGEAGGAITFGGTDDANCDADVTWTPLTAADSWRFELQKFEFDSFEQDEAADALLQTGVSFVGVPAGVFAFVVKQLSAQFDSTFQLYTVECAAAPDVPKLLFTVADTQLFVEGPEWILDYGMEDGMCGLALFDLSTVQSAAQWVVGAPFARAYCGLYDVGGLQLGFARAKHPN